METYTFLRAFADSWFLIAMFLFFASVGVWAFWPSQRAAQRQAAEIPFRDEVPACQKACPDCACKAVLKGLKDV
jgi:cytochrome c oxidase cbb3-type subunit 4